MAAARVARDLPEPGRDGAARPAAPGRAGTGAPVVRCRHPQTGRAPSPRVRHRGRRPGAAGLAVGLATLALTGPAQAHGAAKGLGPFWDTSLHLVTGAEHLLGFVGLGLWLAQQRTDPAREGALLVLPGALVAGLLLAALIGPVPRSTLLAAACLAAIGLLLVLEQGAAPAGRRLAVLALALVQGALLAGPADLLPQALAGALTAFLLTLYSAALARLARAFWARVALRVAGSWITAVAILVLASAR